MNEIFYEIERLSKGEEYSLALKVIEESLEKRSNNDTTLKNSVISNLYFWKGKILDEMGEREKALKAVEISSYYKKTIENLLLLITLNADENRHDVILKYLKELKKLGKNDVELWSKLGKTYLALRNYKDALNAFMEGLNLERDNRDIIFYIAVSLYYLNRHNESLEWLFKLEFKTYETATLVIENYRNLDDWNKIKNYMLTIEDFDLLSSLGLYLSRNDNLYYDFYLEILEEIKSKDLEFEIKVILQKIEILNKNEQKKLVEKELKKALEIYPNNPKIIANAAYYLEDVDKISLYLKALEKSQNLEEEYKDWINVCLGELYYKIKEYQKAYQYSKKVILPRYKGSACEQVVCSLLKLKKEDLIIEYACTLELEFLLRLKNRVFSQEYLDIYEAILNKTFYQDLETDLKRQLELVRIAITKGDREKSIRTLSNIAILGNEFYKIKLELGNIYGSLKFHEEALKYLFNTEECSTEELYYQYRMIIWNLEKLKRYEEVVTYCRKLLKFDDYKNDPEILIEMGYSLGELNRFEESLAYYYKAMRCIEPNFRLLNNIGHTLQQLNRYIDALDYYEDAIEYLGENPDFKAEIYSEIGVCFIMLNRIQEGEAALEIAIEAGLNIKETKRIRKLISEVEDKNRKR